MYLFTFLLSVFYFIACSSCKLCHLVDSTWMLKRRLSMYHVTSVFGFHRHGCPPTVLHLPQSISVHVCQAKT